MGIVNADGIDGAAEEGEENRRPLSCRLYSGSRGVVWQLVSGYRRSVDLSQLEAPGGLATSATSLRGSTPH